MQTFATRVKVGRFTVTTLPDGLFPCGPDMIAAAASDEGRFLYEEAGFPAAGPSSEPINAFAIQHDGRLWLIDAGCGDTAGPDLGHVMQALEAAGHEASEVEAVVLTHMHPDHIAGLLTPGATLEERRAAFPGAKLIIPDAELAFWCDPASPTAFPREPRVNFGLASAVLAAYRGRIEGVPAGAVLVPGLRLVPLPGHTKGHSGVAVEDGGQAVLMWADIVHSTLLQLRHPTWSIGFDLDPAQAVQCRETLLARLAADGTKVVGSHVTGLGTIRPYAGGYAFLPLGRPA